MTESSPPMVPVDLREDGLLWLINKAVFHPRGYALAVGVGDDSGALWLLGDGSEPWKYDVDEDTPFLAVERALQRAKESNL